MFLQLDSIYLSAWNVFKKNWWQYVIVSLIMTVLMFFPVGGILQFFVMLLMINAILKVLRGNLITFSSFFKFKEIFNTKVIIFVVALGIYAFMVQVVDIAAVSVILAIIIFMFSVFCFPIMCVLIDKQFGIKEIILYSAKLTKTVRLEILLIMLVNFVIGMLGILLFFIGIFVAVPIVMIANAKIYLLLEEKLNSQQVA